MYYFVCNWVWMGLSAWTWVGDSLQEHGQLNSDYTTEGRSNIYYPSQPLTANMPLGVGRASWALLSTMKCQWVQSCATFVQVTNPAVNSWVHWPYFVWNTLFCSSPPQHLAISLAPLSKYSMSFKCGCNIDVLFRDEHSTVSYSLHFDQLWTSILTVIHCKKKFLSVLRAALIYRYKDKYLESNLALYPFSKIIVVGSPLGPITCQVWGKV